MIPEQRQTSQNKFEEDYYCATIHNSAHPTYIHNIFLCLISLYFFISISLVRLFVAGVPVRSLLAIAIPSLIFMLYPTVIKLSLREMRKPLLVVLYAAIIGFFISILNQLPLNKVVGQLIEIHVQAAVGLISGCALLKIIGPRKLIWSFIFAVVISSIFAVLQALGIDFSWRIREALQTIQTYDIDNLFLNERLRAMGLSFSPVHLATQICLAFAGYYGLKIYQSSHRRFQKLEEEKWIYFAILAALIVLVLSGNRSPILGFIVFLALFVTYSRPLIAIVSSMVLIPCITLVYFYPDFLLNILSETGLRAFRVGDKSSEGREVLRAFGLLLFLDHPLGYGLIFKSTEYAAEYWDKLYSYTNPTTIYNNVVHNYYMNMTHKYGIMIMPLAIYVVKNIYKNLYLTLAFIPYAIHIFFHNDGPLQSDFLIWYILPIFVLISTQSYKNQNTGGIPKQLPVYQEGNIHGK